MLQVSSCAITIIYRSSLFSSQKYLGRLMKATVLVLRVRGATSRGCGPMGKEAWTLQRMSVHVDNCIDTIFASTRLRRVLEVEVPIQKRDTNAEKSCRRPPTTTAPIRRHLDERQYKPRPLHAPAPRGLARRPYVQGLCPRTVPVVLCSRCAPSVWWLLGARACRGNGDGGSAPGGRRRRRQRSPWSDLANAGETSRRVCSVQAWPGA
jgi:hypothetical protein